MKFKKEMFNELDDVDCSYAYLEILLQKMRNVIAHCEGLIGGVRHSDNPNREKTITSVVDIIGGMLDKLGSVGNIISGVIEELDSQYVSKKNKTDTSDAIGFEYSEENKDYDDESIDTTIRC